MKVADIPGSSLNYYTTLDSIAFHMVGRFPGSESHIFLLSIVDIVLIQNTEILALFLWKFSYKDLCQTGNQSSKGIENDLLI